jgi:hypothetical protein
MALSKSIQDALNEHINQEFHFICTFPCPPNGCRVRRRMNMP